MNYYETWLSTLDRVAEENEISRRDQLLLDAAEVQLVLGNLGAASELMDKVGNYPLFKCFLNLKDKY